jgi:hypothetical protein
MQPISKQPGLCTSTPRVLRPTVTCASSAIGISKPVTKVTGMAVTCRRLVALARACYAPTRGHMIQQMN